jgi:nitroreductase
MIIPGEDMDFFETVSQRTSVRKYKDKPLPKGDLEKIVDAGRQAPSARGVEPWEFIVVREKNTLALIAEKAPNGAFLKQAAAAIIIVCRDTKHYLEDGCAACENILLAAAALGIGACWIAGDKKDYAESLKDLLGVAAGYKLVCLISLGYPALAGTRTQKRPLKEIIHWEKF